MVRHWHYFTPLAMPPRALSYPAEVRPSIERLPATLPMNLARKTMRNPIVGEIELTGDALELPGEGLT